MCFKTQKQAVVLTWYEERQKRIIASQFGGKINRRIGIEPRTIINGKLKSKKNACEYMPASLKCGTENNANAIRQHTASWSSRENFETEIWISDKLCISLTWL